MLRRQSKYVSAFTLAGLSFILAAHGTFGQQTEVSVTQRYLPESAVGIVSVWPASMAASERMRLAPLEVVSAMGIESFGIDPLKVIRGDLVLAIDRAMGPQFGLLLQSSEAIQPSEELIDANGVQKEGEFEYFPLNEAPDELTMVRIDEKTVIFGTRPFVRQMLEAATPDSELSRVVGAVRTQQDALLIVSMNGLRPMLLESLNFVPMPAGVVVEDVRTIIESTNFAALRVQISDEERLQLLVSAKGEEGARAVAASTKQLVEFMGETMVSEFGRSIPDDSLVGAATWRYMKRLTEVASDSMTPKITQDRLVYELKDLKNSGLIGALGGMLIPAMNAAREAGGRMQSTNNLRQLGLAMHNFESAYRRLPATAGLDDDGKPMLSWRVAILPFIEQNNLYQRFNLDEPWDSEHNLALLKEMPETYKNPKRATEPGYTVYQAAVSDETLLRATEPTRFADITDGLSNTVMLLETTADKAVPWTAPQDYEVDMDNPHKGLFEGGISTFLFGDGSTKTIAESIDANILKAIYTRAGGEIVDLSGASAKQ